MNKSLLVLPLFVFIGLILLFNAGLTHDPRRLPSALVGHSLPAMYLEDTMHPGQYITRRDFLGRVTVLNVWASWCGVCRSEHPVLVDVSRTPGIYMIGLSYKDSASAVKHWLKIGGNPYKKIINDANGMLAMNLGVYGVPETFVVDAKGIVRYVHIGAITHTAWRHRLLPEIKKWS